MRQTLNETLTDLHEQLAKINDLDQEEITSLRNAADEIQQTLDASDVDSASLAKRLQDATEHFSETHQVLTNTIGRIADLLSQMGI